MPHYKICVSNPTNESENETFAIKPQLESFDSFKDEIFIRMPELQNHPLKMYYRDFDGDNITIFNASDFEIFLKKNVFKIFLKAPGARAIHPDVTCDGCNKGIWGYRYKCLQCDNFDLCMNCQSKLHNHHLMLRIADPIHTDSQIFKALLNK